LGAGDCGRILTGEETIGDGVILIGEVTMGEGTAEILNKPTDLSYKYS
jgi:hypothetical protein